MNQQLENQKTNHSNQMNDLHSQVQKLENDKAKAIIKGTIDAAGKIKDEFNNQNPQEQNTNNQDTNSANQ